MKDSCTFCNSNFDTIHRRHHCKHCGKTACGKCSSKTVALPKFGYHHAVRVCDFCFAILERPESSTSLLTPTPFIARKPAPVPPQLETAYNLPAKFSLMTTDFPAVLNQATAGAKEITIFKDFCARIARHEAESARKLEKIMNEEMSKLVKVFEVDRVTPFTSMWERVIGCMKKTIDLDLKKAATIESEVIAPLAALEKLVTNKLREITNASKKYEGEMTKAVDALMKSQEQCQKLLASISETAANSNTITPSTISTLPISNNANNSSNNKGFSDPQLKINTLKQHLLDHTIKIAEANKQSAVLAEGLGGCLDELQAVEAHRIQMILNSLEQFFLSRQEANRPEDSDIPLEMVRSVNARQCLHMFIADWISDFGPKLEREMFVYSLPLTAQQLEEGHVLRKGCQMFDLPLVQLLEKEKQGGITLSPLQALDVQKKPLEVPLIMHTLCQAIYNMGGLQTEGIFRVSVDSTLLMDLRNQFDNGNFSLDLMKGDPHAAACLLKLWLRSLTDPIIHRSLYTEACVGYNEICIRLIEARRIDPTVKAEEQSREICLSVYNKLSSSYQAIVRTLSILIKDVLAHSEENLMSYEALAVVFAPGFFRSPSCEPMEVMQQNRRELQFLVAFLKTTCAAL